MKHLAIAPVLFVASVGLAWAQGDRIGDIEVSNPWAPATGGTLTSTAVYLSLTDRGAKSDELIGASSVVAQKTELHVFGVENGVYGMHKVNGIEIAPGGAATVLQPGGAHVMLESLKRALRAGTTFPLTLNFQRAGQLQVEVRVESPQAAVANAGNHRHQALAAHSAAAIAAKAAIPSE
jgi:periplasmic copper chaperone A